MLCHDGAGFKEKIFMKKPQVVILAGGLGTRLSEETSIRPKPMVEIGTHPILWHIMKIYAHYGFDDFIICLGYKGEYIKQYFAQYFMHQSDMTIDLAHNTISYKNTIAEKWKITLVQTGLHDQTGSRIKQIQPYITGNTFMMTYGDGVADVDLNALLSFHQGHGKIGTLTAVQPTGKFGSLHLSPEGGVQGFQEKIAGDGRWINGGFFVLNQKIFNYLENNVQCIFERTPLETLANENQLMSYKHHAFWKPMDTLRDKLDLAEMVESGQAPWMVWNQ